MHRKAHPTSIRSGVVAEAPEGSLEKKVIYPVAVVKATAHEDAAKAFVDFLQTPEAIAEHNNFFKHRRFRLG